MLTRTRMLNVMFSVISLSTMGIGQNFSASLNVVGGLGEYDLTVGFSPGATDGYDQGIDAYAPPAPPPPAFDAALGWGGERYYTQIVNGSSDDLVEHEWEIQLAYPPENLINLTWNNSGWNSIGTFILQDAFDGALGIDIDMTESTSLTLTDPAFNILKLKVTPAEGPPYYGCTDESAINYNPYASINDGSCYHGVVTDVDGNEYQAVQIGDQLWMKENLKVTHYRNGDNIPNITNNGEWGGDTTGAYGDYNNNPLNSGIYGRLYNWYAVVDERAIAPDGWHVPTNDEWETLIDFLGGQSIAGGQLKSTGTTDEETGLWKAPNEGATNESGFTGLPGGYRDNDTGGYEDVSVTGSFWTSTELHSSASYQWSLYHDWEGANGSAWHNTHGYSVRCVMNEPPEPSIINIYDIPDDQGGWVKIVFEQSSFDTDTLRSTELYTVERRDGSEWVSLHSILAYGLSSYTTEARTLQDSSSATDGMTVYRIIAGMDEGNFASEPDSGYSVDNIAPEAPTGLTADGNGQDGIDLSWGESEALDFDYFRIYRDITQGFIPTTPLVEIVEAIYSDTDADLQNTYYYRISSVDTHDNESEFSDEVSSFVLSIGGMPFPLEFVLQQNYPNPFNPITTLRYDLPFQAFVTLTIYDLSGKEITKLVHATQEPGFKSVQWNSTDIQGKLVSAGIYLYQIRSGDFIQTKKMVLLK
jgi:uncharacterized protein (TIGR02145 family)